MIIVYKCYLLYLHLPYTHMQYLLLTLFILDTQWLVYAIVHSIVQSFKYHKKKNMSNRFDKVKLS